MSEETQFGRISVGFHSSSTGKGEAYDVSVELPSMAISEAEAQRVFELAASLRRQALAELAPRPLADVLAESIKEVANART